MVAVPFAVKFVSPKPGRNQSNRSQNGAEIPMRGVWRREPRRLTHMTADLREPDTCGDVRHGLCDMMGTRSERVPML